MSVHGTTGCPTPHHQSWLWPGLFAVLFCTTVTASTNDTIVTTVTTAPITGELIRFSLAEGVTVATEDLGEPQRFPAGDIVQVVLRDPAPSAPPAATRLELVGGDVLLGRVVDFADDVLTVESATLGPLPVPLERVMFWRTTTPVDRRLRPAIAGLATRTATDGEDALLLRNGDLIRGFISSIDASGFTVETASGDSRIDQDSVVAAAIVPTDEDLTREGNDPRVRILTTDGQRLTASAFDWSETSVTATLFGRFTQRLPADRIARLEVLDGRWVWLATLHPISYEHQAALGPHWQWTADRNVKRGPIRVAGQAYEHGIGMHSESSITFDLRGDYREFVTSLGMDDDSGPYANVDVEIRVDGQLRHTQDGLTRGTLHGPLRLDLTGAKRIKLTVLFGANADLQDRFNWVDAALIR